MQRGTACLSSAIDSVTLGLEIRPSYLERLDGILTFTREPETICREWGLPSDLGEYHHRYIHGQPLIQDAFYTLDSDGSLTRDQRTSLSQLVGPVQLEAHPTVSALVHRYQDPVAVFAQMTLEMDIERRAKPGRDCLICGDPVPKHYRRDRLTCSEDCARLRKREADRSRYRRQCQEASRR